VEVGDESLGERAARVAEVLQMVDLTDSADRLAATFSGGIVRRLELTRALSIPSDDVRF
jgi:ABC-type multidrug transport system ATPase subunit